MSQVKHFELPDGTIVDVPSGGEGTSVEPNPELSGDEEVLNSIKIADTKYKIEGGGGTQVIANPEEEPTDNLNKIQIEDKVYTVSGGGSGAAADISYEKIEESLPFDNVQDAIDTITYGNPNVTGACSYEITITPPDDSSTVVDYCHLLLKQYVDGKIADTFEGTLNDVGAHYFHGFDDAGVWHDLAFNGSAGYYITVYSNKDGLVYNDTVYNKRQSIYSHGKLEPSNNIITNGSELTIYSSPAASYIKYDITTKTSVRDAIDALASRVEELETKVKSLVKASESEDTF